MRRVLRAAASIAIAGLTVTVGQTIAAAQKLSTSDLAAKLSGTWMLNRELSTGFRAPAPGRRGGGGAALFAVAGMTGQRGGRGGGGAGGATDATDLTPQQRAEQAAMRQLQQISEKIVITASAETVTFTDSRGERTFTVNDKSTKIDVGGSPVNVKSKWDKNVLRQEFSNTQAKLIETWGLDDAGRLVLTAKVESMTLLTPEQKAVFDRQ
jgi:Spy/CpxP family protein refolding chaperone